MDEKTVIRCEKCNSLINPAKARRRLLKDTFYFSSLFETSGRCACGQFISNIFGENKSFIIN